LTGDAQSGRPAAIASWSRTGRRLGGAESSRGRSPAMMAGAPASGRDSVGAQVGLENPGSGRLGRGGAEDEVAERVGDERRALAANRLEHMGVSPDHQLCPGGGGRLGEQPLLRRFEGRPLDPPVEAGHHDVRPPSGGADGSGDRLGRGPRPPRSVRPRASRRARASRARVGCGPAPPSPRARSSPPEPRPGARPWRRSRPRPPSACRTARATRREKAARPPPSQAPGKPQRAPGSKRGQLRASKRAAGSASRPASARNGLREAGRDHAARSACPFSPTPACSTSSATTPQRFEQQPPRSAALRIAEY
jgi:hypothetical protein